MTVSPISTPPAAPSRTTDAPATFANKADAWVGWWGTGSAELNTSFGQFNADAATVNTKASQVAANALTVAADKAAVQDIWGAIAAETIAGASGASATSISIGTGSKSFSANTGKLWYPGETLIVYSSASAENFMVGDVSAYNVSTGALTITSRHAGGSGSFSDWIIAPVAGRYIRPWENLGSPVATTSGAAVTLANIDTIYNDLKIDLIGVSSTGAGNLQIEFSPDSASWTAPVTLLAIAAAKTLYGSVAIFDYAGPRPLWSSAVGNLSSDNTGGAGNGFPAGILRVSAGVRAIRISVDSGAFDAGSIQLRAR